MLIDRRFVHRQIDRTKPQRAEERCEHSDKKIGDQGFHQSLTDPLGQATDSPEPEA